MGGITIFVQLLNLVGSVASIFSAGEYGKVIAIILTVPVVLFFIIRSSFFKNIKRFVRLFVKARQIGLVDVVSRSDLSDAHKYERFIQGADKEVVITGITLLRSADQHIETIKGVLNKGVIVYIMMLDPKSSDIEWLSANENKSIADDIKGTLKVLKKEGIDKHPGFKYTYFKKMPTFTAVMIDGDLCPTGEKPKDIRGKIRVYARTEYGTQHRGVILQFEKTNSQDAAFDFFAGDLRQQWEANTIL